MALALLTSVVLNLVLGYLLIGRGSTRDGSLTPAGKPIPEYDSSGDLESRVNAVDRLFVRLKKEFSDADAQTLAFAYVSSKRSQTTDQYWRSPEVRQAQIAVAEYVDQELLRRTLLAKFGDSAWMMPAMSSAFAPYGSSLPSLSPHQQVALQKIKARTAAELTLAVDMHGLDAIPNGKLALEGERLDIRTQFTLDERREVAMRDRDSDQAKRILSGAFQFTESEFRDVFTILTEASEAKVYGDRRIASFDIESGKLERIRRVLSAERYLEFRRYHDPLYFVLSAAKEPFGISSQNILEAYKLLDEVRTRRQQVMQRAEPPLADQIAEIRQIDAKADLALQSLLGAAAARQLKPNIDMLVKHYVAFEPQNWAAAK